MATKIPRDWTNDPEELRVNDWNAGGDFEEVVDTSVLGKVRPIMCSGRNSDDFLYMFEAGGTFYIWDQIEDTIWRISQPNTETRIIEVIGERGLKGLGLDALAEVEEED